MSKNKGLGKLLAGLGIGVGLGLLFAPQTGEKTRKDVKEKCDELLNQIKEIDVDEVKKNITEKIQKLEEELADLDKEKAIEIAKVKGEEIKKQAEDIYKEAVKQGKPALEKAAKAVKVKTVEVLKEVITKLEEK